MSGFVYTKQLVVYFFCVFLFLKKGGFMTKILRKALLLTAVMVVGVGTERSSATVDGGVLPFRFSGDAGYIGWGEDGVRIRDITVDDQAKTFCGYAPGDYNKALTNQNIQHASVSPREVVFAGNFFNTTFSCADFFAIRTSTANFRMLVQARTLSLELKESTFRVFIGSREGRPFLLSGSIDLKKEPPFVDLIVINAECAASEGKVETITFG
jgi:hypothetical protein